MTERELRRQALLTLTLGETLDRLLAFVDRNEQDEDDLAILDATIAKARGALE